MDEENRNKGDRNEGVDMNNTAIGYTETGEWIEYTVEVEKDGEYVVESRVASGDNGAAFTLYMDNTFIIPGDDGTPGGFVKVPNTGDWSTFTTVETKLNKLTKGVHVLKVEITGDWVDLDYMDFKLVGSEESHVTDYVSSGNSLPDGFYFAYDASGKLVKTVIIQNAYSSELGQGFYILKDAEGRSYPMLVK